MLSFLVPTTISLVIAMLTIATQSFSAAQADSVKESKNGMISKRRYDLHV
jgi:hypothetical protein